MNLLDIFYGPEERKRRVEKREVERLISEFRTQRGSLEVLRQLGAYSEAVPYLAQVLTFRKVEWKQVAAELLPRFGVSVVPHLLPLLDHHDVEARRAAIAVLAQINDPSLFERFVSLSAAEDLRTRCLSASVLVKFGERAVPALRAMLDRPTLAADNPVGALLDVGTTDHGAAAKALAQIGGPEAKAAVIEYSSRMDATAMLDVVTALAILGYSQPEIEGFIQAWGAASATSPETGTDEHG